MELGGYLVNLFLIFHVLYCNIIVYSFICDFLCFRIRNLAGRRRTQVRG